MAKIDFVPTRDSELDNWMGNFETKAVSLAQQLGVAQEDITKMQALIQARESAFQAMHTKREEAKAATKAYMQAKKTAVSGVRSVARRFKASPTYSTALGTELGIVGAENTAAKTAMKKPSLKVTYQGGKVTIAFVKGKADGIRLYCRRGGEKDFTFLDVKMSSPYLDNRPNLVPGQPETRQYQAYFLKKDELMGDVSDTVSITVS